MSPGVSFNEAELQQSTGLLKRRVASFFVKAGGGEEDKDLSAVFALCSLDPTQVWPGSKRKKKLKKGND